MKPVKIVIFVSLLLSIMRSSGQERNIAHDNEQDKKYTPNPSSIFNNLNKKKDQTYSSDITIKNIVKFSPTALLRYKVMFYYERQVGKNITLNAGIGKAFGDDFFQRSFFGIRSLVGEDSKLLPYDMLKNGKFDRSSPNLYLGARIYFSSSVFDEGFIELGYRYESMEYLLDPYINGNRVVGSNRTVFKMNAFTIGYGYTELMGAKNNFSQEFHINFGIKFFRFSEFDKLQDQYAYGPDPVYIYQKTGGEQKIQIVPSVNITYCLGFGF